MCGSSPWAACRTSRSCSRASAGGARVASRMRREARAAPRRITHDAASANEHAHDADDGTPRATFSNSPVMRPSEAKSGERRAPQRLWRQRQLLSSGARRPSGRHRSARAAAHDARRCPGRRLDLAESVEIPELGRRVRGCARPRGNARRAARPSGSRLGAGPCFFPATVPWYPCRASDSGDLCLDHVAMCLGEQIRARERLGSRDLVHHLALARARHLDRVEVLRDLVVVPREQLQPLDRVVDLLEDVFLLRLRPGGHVRVAGHGSSTIALSQSPF